jgi:hypothetical protein
MRDFERGVAHRLIVPIDWRALPASKLHAFFRGVLTTNLMGQDSIRVGKGEARFRIQANGLVITLLFFRQWQRPKKDKTNLRVFMLALWN